MLRLSATNYVVFGGTLFLCVLAGTIPSWMPLAYFSAALALLLGFYLTIRRRWNLRLRDPGLLAPQMLASGAVHLGFLLLAPQLAFAFLSRLFVTFAFAVVQFNVRQFAMAWLLAAGATAAVLSAVWDRLALPARTPAEVMLLWVFLISALAQFARISAHTSEMRGKLSSRNKELARAVERIQELADHDELTQAYNRRFFMRLLEEEKARADRTAQGFCLAMFDLDHFKSINDRYGHQVGDRVLQIFCETAGKSIRGTDRFARYGGEEFILLLTATPAGNAPIALERIREAVMTQDWAAVAPGLDVTVSVGFTAYAAPETMQELLKRADSALYEAKHAGRNRVVAA